MLIHKCARSALIQFCITIGSVFQQFVCHSFIDLNQMKRERKLIWKFVNAVLWKIGYFMAYPHSDFELLIRIRW